MNKYYYFVSQLPFLQLGKISPVSTDDFLAEAGKWLSDKEFSFLKNARLDKFENFKKQEPAALKEFNEFEYRLREQIYLYRKARKQEKEYRLSGALGQIFSEGNPLDIEKGILRLRWEFLDEKETFHHFDLNFIVIYFLKMQLVLRLSSFDKEKGAEIFGELSKINM